MRKPSRKFEEHVDEQIRVEFLDTTDHIIYNPNQIDLMSEKDFGLFPFIRRVSSSLPDTNEQVNALREQIKGMAGINQQVKISMLGVSYTYVPVPPK